MAKKHKNDIQLNITTTMVFGSGYLALNALNNSSQLFKFSSGSHVLNNEGQPNHLI